MKFGKNLFCKLFVLVAIVSPILLVGCAEEEIEEEVSTVSQKLPCWAWWCPINPEPNPGPGGPAPMPGNTPHPPSVPHP